MRSFKTAITALAFLFGVGLSAAPAHAAGGTGEVVVTLKPLHSLVQSVMGGTGKAILLVDGIASPHGFSLKPSQIRAIQNAKVVFFVDEDFEGFLDNALDAAPESVIKFPFADKAGLHLLPIREGGAWDPHHHHHGAEHQDEAAEEHHDGAETDENHDHEHHHHHGEHGELNLHVWLDIGNAEKMATAVATELSKIHPENAAIYEKNATALKSRLAALDARLASELKAVAGKPYIVLHDAYPYFEKRYGLTAVGSITIDPDQPPSAHRIQAIRQKIRDAHAVCLFREPEFSDKLVKTVAEGLPVHLSVLDPLGADFKAGPDLYEKALQQIADNLKSCLNRK